MIILPVKNMNKLLKPVNSGKKTRFCKPFVTLCDCRALPGIFHFLCREGC